MSCLWQKTLFTMIICFLVSILFCYTAMAQRIVVGSSSGKVTLVEFYDYQCPHCRKMAKVIDYLIKTNPKLRVEYRVIPAFGFMSRYEANAAIASYLQGKRRYLRFRHLLLTNRVLSRGVVMFLANRAHLDGRQLLIDMQSIKTLKVLRSNVSAFMRQHLNNVPTFIIKKSNSSKVVFQYSGELAGSILQNKIQMAMSGKDV